MGARLIFGLMALFLSGCAVQRAQVAQQARADVVGRTKAEILACAGVPSRAMTEGATEILAYQYDGDVQVFGGSSSSGTISGNMMGASISTTGGFGGTARQLQCTANFVLQSGRVVALNYSGRTGGGILTQGEQCAFIVSNCVSKQ